MSSQQILLMGPPNVGKSVIFNQLTGLNVSCANYAGTTVEFTAGKMDLRGKEAILVDVPGTYTLDATNEAEKVAVDMLKGAPRSGISAPCSHCEQKSDVCPEDLSSNPSAVICVVDANNLESSLYLLFQILEFGLPTVVALNRVDLARDKNIRINEKLLSNKLSIPVVPTVATESTGFPELRKKLRSLLEEPMHPQLSWAPDQHWTMAEKLTREVASGEETQLRSRRRQWGEKLVQPWPGLPIAALILALSFAGVVGLGMQLRQLILLPFFRELIIPQIVLAVQAIPLPAILQDIMIGEYGFLVKGIEWPFALVLPYVLSFYAVMSVLEDSGYLPRLGVLLDGLLNKIGLQGSSIIPLLMGYGCGIPAILATRNLASGKERLIIVSMICMAVPCISQTGAFIAMLAERSVGVVAAVFGLSLLVLVLSGIIMDKLLKGPKPLTVMEIPELLPPQKKVILKKIWVQFKRYITDGALPMVLAVGVAAVLYETGIMAAVGRFLSPLVVNWLHLPEEASVPLILGIMRRELTVLPLLEMELTTLQLFVGASVGLFYVPCIAIVVILAREFGLKVALLALLATSATAFLLGGAFARMGSLVQSLV